MNILVREFEEADRASLRQLYVASRRAAFTWIAAESHQALDFDAHTQGEVILVAVANAQTVGFASIWKPDSFVHNLFVHPSFMRQGVGSVLLTRCARYCADAPTLKCMKANVNAMQFYTAQGWTVRQENLGPEGPYLLMQAPYA